jgi:uncharacterized protein YndB with AHSA1/START domain
MREKISIQIVVKASLQSVWEKWTTPKDIIQWNHASEDWHTTEAVNDLRPGGCFSYRMEAKDGSVGFDFSGVHNTIERNERIKSTLDDGRSLTVIFKRIGNSIEITETFEADNENPIELQRLGWLAILNNFGKYVEDYEN